MATITINTINGTPPYTIYVCNTFLFNCIFVSSGITSLPFVFETPSDYTNSPSVILKIVDSQLCEYNQTYNCITPTPSVTRTVTPTLTPSNTLTPFTTPTNTQTPYTPTPTPTLSLTPTFTPSPTITPSTTPQPIAAVMLFIEPVSGNTLIGNYMNSLSSKFFGFSNGVAPSTNQTDFDFEMNKYLDFSGWTSGEFPDIIKTTVVDAFRAVVTNFNFLPINLSANTISGDAWYTFIIPTGFTDGKYQKEVVFASSNIYSQSNISMNPTIYSNYFNYTGYSYNRTTYRVYTTFPSPEFLLSNGTDLFFSGSTIGT